MEHLISKNFTLFVNNKTLGPFSFNKIITLLEEGKIHVGQYIYDHETSAWALVGDIEIFKEFAPERPIIMPEVARYYTYEDMQVQGPFRKLEIIKRLDGQEINLFNFIYAAGEDTWVRLKDHKDFVKIAPNIPSLTPTSTSKKIGPIEATVTGFPVPIHMKKDMGFKDKSKKWEKMRKFKRSPFSAPVSVQYGDNIYPGFVTEIGVGGCFVEFNWRQLERDDEVILKIMPGIVPLSLECRARTASFVAKGKKGAGFEFINLSKEKGMEIQKFVEKFAQKLGG